MITDRPIRPNRQPVLQQSSSKVARQAEQDPNLYGPGARQGRGPLIVSPCCWQCERPIEDNDDAHVCIECGGLNRRTDRRATINTGPLTGVLLYLLGWPAVVVAVAVAAVAWKALS